MKTREPQTTDEQELKKLAESEAARTTGRCPTCNARPLRQARGRMWCVKCGWKGEK